MFVQLFELLLLLRFLFHNNNRPIKHTSSLSSFHFIIRNQPDNMIYLTNFRFND